MIIENSNNSALILKNNKVSFFKYMLNCCLISLQEEILSCIKLNIYSNKIKSFKKLVIKGI